MESARSEHDRAPGRYHFGPFVVDVAAARLFRDGAPVHLEPKVFELLVYLLAHRRRVVGKEELVEKIWQGAFVSDNALTKAVARLRKALGDSPERPRYIATRHSRGYRFVGTLQKEGPPAIRRPSKPWRIATGLLALLTATTAGWLILDKNPPAPSSGSTDLRRIESLAILPLENLTGDPTKDFLVEGLHELLTTELASLRPLRVISRQSTLPFRGGEPSIPQVAARLGVDAVVTGSVMRTGGRTRVTVQLFPADREIHLWADSFGRQDDNLLALMSDVARAVASEVQVALPADQESRLAAYGSAKPEAQEGYLQARYLLSLGKSGDREEALRLLTRAVETDPEFAAAHAALAGAHVLTGFFGEEPVPEARARAEAAARAALALDPHSAGAHGALGFVRLYFDWNPEAAGKELASALELNPNDASIRHGYGDYLTALGRPEEGLAQVRIGRQCDPASPLAIGPVLGHLLFLGRFQEVVDESGSLLESDPDFFLARMMRFRALWQLGRHQEALDAIGEQLSRTDPEAWAALERGWLRDGPSGAMLGIGRLLAERQGEDPQISLVAARYLAAGGAVDEALERLEVAFEARVPQLLHLPVEPEFASLRSDPRFQELKRRLGFLPPPASTT